MKILLDSSGWIEFFTGGPLADRYATYLTSRHDIITPTIVLYEVYKKIKRERGEETALHLLRTTSCNSGRATHGIHRLFGCGYEPSLRFGNG